MAQPFQEGQQLNHPPSNVATGFVVHDDMLMREACCHGEMNKAREEDRACRNNVAGNVELADQREEFS